jgi:hypothetical protein
MKQFLLYLFCLIICSNIKAQEAPTKWTIGFKGGVSFGALRAAEKGIKIPALYSSFQSEYQGAFLEMDYSITPFNSFRLGGLAGITVDYAWRKKLTIRAELNLEQKGISLNSANTIIDGNFVDGNNNPIIIYDNIKFKRKAAHDYLNIPLIIQLDLDEEEQFYAEAGLYLALLLNSKTAFNTERVVVSKRGDTGATVDSVNFKNIYNAPINTPSGTLDTKKYTKSLDYGIILGLGRRWTLGEKLNLNFGIRLNFGLSGLDKLNNNEYTETKDANNIYTITNRNYLWGFDSRSKNFALQLSLGMQYKL